MDPVFIHTESLSSEDITSTQQTGELQMLRGVAEYRLRLALESNRGGLTLDRRLRGGLFKYPMEVLLTKN